MRIEFKSKKLKKQLTDPRELVKALGQRAKKAKQRMEEFKAADSLAEIATLSGPRCHELKGDYAGQLAVDISGNYRIVFEPHHNPIPEKEDGGLDWKQVTAIRILQIEDYH